MKKKILALLLVGCMGGTMLTGCGNEDKEDASGGTMLTECGNEGKEDASAGAAEADRL